MEVINPFENSSSIRQVDPIRSRILGEVAKFIKKSGELQYPPALGFLTGRSIYPNDPQNRPRLRVSSFLPFAFSINSPNSVDIDKLLTLHSDMSLALDPDVDTDLRLFGVTDYMPTSKEFRSHLTQLADDRRWQIIAFFEPRISPRLPSGKGK